MGVCCSSRDGGGRSRTNPVAVTARSMAAMEGLRKKQIDMEAFVQKIISEGKPWTDPDFPPERSSLYDPSIDSVDTDQFDSYEWKRASEIFDPVYVFEDGVEPNDINQG